MGRGDGPRWPPRFRGPAAPRTRHGRVAESPRRRSAWFSLALAVHVEHLIDAGELVDHAYAAPAQLSRARSCQIAALRRLPIDVQEGIPSHHPRQRARPARQAGPAHVRASRATVAAPAAHIAQSRA
jgi:hypothetical protein